MIHIFIINPVAGKMDFVPQLRKELSDIHDIEYYLLFTCKEMREQELVKVACSLFEGEHLRFYCCGGAGTLRNMIDGIPNLKNTEVAYYPTGATNDFVKVFGESAKEFRNLKALVEGEVVPVDYIQTNLGPCMNTVSTGMDADILSRVEDYATFSVISEATPYAIGLLRGMAHNRPREYRVMADGEEFVSVFSEIMFGNGGYVGGRMTFDPDVDITDGIGKCILRGRETAKESWLSANAMLGKDADKIRKYTPHKMLRKISFSRTNGKPMVVNLDGDLRYGVAELNAEIIPEGLNFVVPKGVKMQWMK